MHRAMSWLLAVTAMGLLQCASAGSRDLRRCRELGFSPALHCSACASLSEFVADSELNAQCTECCRSDSQLKFKTAVLQVCDWRIRGLPELVEFVDNRATKYPTVTVEFIRGMAPRLALRDEHKRVREVVGVGAWKADAIEEFLREKLES